jgi:hypothetical protein
VCRTVFDAVRKAGNAEKHRDGYHCDTDFEYGDLDPGAWPAAGPITRIRFNSAARYDRRAG